MKFFFIIFFVSFFSHSQDLERIRKSYPAAVESAEITTKFDTELSRIYSEDSPVLVAYKGAILTLMAKFSKSKKDKKNYFKVGVSLIETAVKTDPKNIEIHYIRLSVQENSPKFLGYHKNLEKDKQFILKNYANVTSKELKDVLKDFVLKSENFDDTERKSFQ